MATDLAIASSSDCTEALILRLQLEDIKAICDSHKRKGREGEISDIDLALQLYQQELEQNVTILADKRMATSIANAVRLDEGVISASILEEQVAARDRSMAGRLSGNPDIAVAQPTVLIDDADERRLTMIRLEKAYEEPTVGTRPISSDSDGEEQIAESSAWAMSRATILDHLCIACRESRGSKEVFQAHCEHEYCRDCLSGLFKSSLTDVSLFPPRCCRQEMTLDSVKSFLEDTELMNLFERKRIELSTTDKTYCHSPTCSAFIFPERIQGDLAVCEECALVTCTMCKLASHDDDCPADQGLKQVLALTTEEGWQRCGKCKRVIELNFGCNHIT
jgi:IBR domain, a half RING-finger domain